MVNGCKEIEFTSWTNTFNIKRDLNKDVYTILNRIKLTIWTICTFRVVDPHQRSLAKQSSFKAKQTYRGMIETQKSGNKTSSGEIGLDIRTHASPKVGQDQVSGRVSVLCWHASPVANILLKLQIGAPKVPKQAEAKRDGEINPQN